MLTFDFLTKLVVGSLQIKSDDVSVNIVTLKSFKYVVISPFLFLNGFLLFWLALVKKIVLVIVTIMRNHSFTSHAFLWRNHLRICFHKTWWGWWKISPSNIGYESLYNASHCWKYNTLLWITVQKPVVATLTADWRNRLDQRLRPAVSRTEGRWFDFLNPPHLSPAPSLSSPPRLPGRLPIAPQRWRNCTSNLCVQHDNPESEPSSQNRSVWFSPN